MDILAKSTFFDNKYTLVSIHCRYMCCAHLKDALRPLKRSLAGSPRVRSYLLGFLGHFGHLGGLLGFCCLVFRGILRFLRVGYGFGFGTTDFAAGAYSIVLANARTTTLLALAALSIVLAYACTTTLLAMIASSVVLAYARATTLLTAGALTAVLAEA